MAISCTAAKLLWPSNFSIPASQKISGIACINAVTGQATVQAIWGNQPDQGATRKQMWFMRITSTLFTPGQEDRFSFTVATNTGAVAHFYGTKKLKQGTNVVSFSFDYATNTAARLRYIAEDGATMEEDVAVGAYTTTTEVNPVVALASGDGTIPFLSTVYWMHLFDADLTDANYEQCAGITSPGSYRNAMRFLKSNRINGVDFTDARSCSVDNRTREALTLSGTYSAAANLAAIEQAVTATPAGTPLNDSTDLSAYTLSGVTCDANKPILIAVFVSKGTVVSTPTLTGGGLTWNQISSYTYITTRGISLFAAYPTAGATFDVMITLGSTHLSCAAIPFVLTGTPNNATFSVQTPVQAQASSGTTATATLAAMGAGNATLLIGECVGAGLSLTEVSPLTKVAEADTAIPATFNGVYIDPAGDTTPELTVGASAQWGVIAMELYAYTAPANDASSMRGRGRGRSRFAMMGR